MERKACQVYASLTNQRCITQMGRGFHLPHMWQYYLRDLVKMLKFKKSALGTVTQSRTAVALFAGTLLLGGGITEASAKSHRHHYRHHHHAHHAGNSPANS